VGIDLTCYLPCDGVFDVEEAGEFARVFQRSGETQLVDLEDLCLHGDPVVGNGVAAYNHKVGVEGLGDSNGGCAGGSEVNGKAKVVQRKLPVVAGDGQEACRGEALVKGVGEGVADPGEVGLSGAIVEGEDEDNAAAGLGSLMGRFRG
jgi:hypothetical protein